MCWSRLRQGSRGVKKADDEGERRDLWLVRALGRLVVLVASGNVEYGEFEVGVDSQGLVTVTRNEHDNTVVAADTLMNLEM